MVSQSTAGRTSGFGGVTFGHAGAFWVGVLLVTGGVVAHLPMYIMGRSMHYRLAGMPMELPMKIGMAAILVGLVVSLYGLIPRNASATAERVTRIRVSALDDAPLTAAHYGLLVTMMLAVTIDIMKMNASTAPAAIRNGSGIPNIGSSFM